MGKHRDPRLSKTKIDKFTSIDNSFYERVLKEKIADVKVESVEEFLKKKGNKIKVLKSKGVK